MMATRISQPFLAPLVKREIAAIFPTPFAAHDGPTLMSGLRLPAVPAWAPHLTGLPGALAVALTVCLVAVEVQGHRGARGLWPEHTAVGFRGALGIGVDVLELDVGLSRDAVPVVHHDPRLSADLTRDAHGEWIEAPGPALWHSLWSDLRAYGIGRARPGGRTARRCPAQRALDGQSLLRLADVFDLARRVGAESVRFNIELKLQPGLSDEFPDPDRFAKAVIAQVGAAQMSARVTLQSFDWRALLAARRIDPQVHLAALTVQQSWLDNIGRGQFGSSPWTAGLDVDDYDGSVPRLVHALGAAVWSPYYRELSGADLELAHRLGLVVSVWTVNKPADIAKMLDLGVDSIISDYPDRVRAVLAQRGLPLPQRYPSK